MSHFLWVGVLLLAVLGGDDAPADSEPADVSHLRDITGIEQVEGAPPENHWYLWAGAAVVGGSGVVLVGWKLAGRRRSEPPALPPHVWALAELERVEGLGLPAAGDIERYHRLVSDTIRRYLELRWQLPASKRTTPEFLRALAAANVLTPPQQQTLGTFLERCDLAKFARAGFTLAECQALAHTARELIEQTANGQPESLPLPPTDRVV